MLRAILPTTMPDEDPIYVLQLVGWMLLVTLMLSLK